MHLITKVQNYWNKKLLELPGKIDKFAIILRDFNNWWPGAPKISEDIGNYLQLHQTRAENTFFSSAYAIFTKTDHVSVNLKDSSYLMFSDHNGIKLEINNRKIAGAFLNIWKLNTSK